MYIDYKMSPDRKIKENKYEIDNIEPVISIITPYYNGGKYIDYTAKSVLNQSFPNFEWIIVDDGSTNEKDKEKLKEIEQMDKRIRILYKKNGGPSETRDYGIANANSKSKYFMFLDSDDMITDTYIECAYWTLETNKGATWTYTDMINFDGQEFLWRKWFNTYRQTKENLLPLASFVRREDIEKVNGFELREKKVYEDWYLWLKFLKNKMYPVKMGFLGTWYRIKPDEESELKQSNNNNKENAMKYIKAIQKGIDLNIKAIQYPKADYKWDYIPDEVSTIVRKKVKNDGKTRILLMIPWMVTGGADKFILDLVSRIDKNRYEFVVIMTEPSNNPWKQQLEQYAEVYDLTSFIDQKYWLSFINYIIETNNIDIIFNTNSKFGYIITPYLKAKYSDKPIIDYIHMEEWYWRNGGFSRDSSSFSSVIDNTFVCNKNSEKVLVEYFKRNPDEISTVYIGVDEKKFDPNKLNKEEILKEYNIINCDKKIISYICRISEQKRPFLLLEIIKKLKEQRNDFIFVIAGDGNLLNDMKKKAKSLGIYNDMIFLGNIKETEKVYKISDITINCSIKEGLALTSYESLSMGVPVISPDVGGQKELINEEVGITVPLMQKETEIFKFEYKEEEINNYVKGLNKVLNNLEYYKRNCRKRILSEFTLDKMVENMSNIFDDKKNNYNREKEINGRKLLANIDITKELITRYFISTKEEYTWLSKKFVKDNIDRDYKYEKNTNYEQTLEYKIKHPIYVILTKLNLYETCKKIIKRGE